MENICSDNFIRIFSEFENRLNLIFQGKTRTLEGGSIRVSKLSGPCRYKKKLVSKDGVTIEIGILYDTVADEYLYYTYNIFFEKTKLMFHYEPTHKEHFQPHINVYVEEKELKNLRGEGIHIISHQYHPFEILALIERYFR